MSLAGRVLGAAAGAATLGAVGTAARVAHRRRVVARRGAGETVPFGTLRARPRVVVADDGVPLHVEVDECGPEAGAAGRRRADRQPEPDVTVVFVHGYALSLDSWHFQRAAYRGLVRAVYYDQRSHGRSGRSEAGHATMDQLGRDLARVVAETAPPGPVVLVGHSMGGMTIAALAEQQPELFGDRITGVALLATTAGGLSPHRVVVPFLPGGLGGQVAGRLVAALARGHRTVDGVRRLGKGLAVVATDELAFGDDVPESYVTFVDEMLAGTPFEVLAEFFPAFDELDKFHAVAALQHCPTTIIGGTADRITVIGHSRKLHQHIDGSELVECEGAGHMVMMERHERVNAALDQLLAAAVEGR